MCIAVVIRGHHLREPQIRGALRRQGCAHDTGGVPHQERHLHRRHALSATDQITLVLAVGVVHDDHEAAPGERRDGGLHSHRSRRPSHVGTPSNAVCVPNNRKW